MVATIDPDTLATVQLPERRVTFCHISWTQYEKILDALGESRSSRLTYDRGLLEITMPLEEHERASELIALFIRILVIQLGMKLKTMGSTTLSYPNLERSAEPDKGFYIQNYPLVADRKVDLTIDPPPDLVVEVDITHTDINKLALYASMGIPEFWRYNGRVLRIYQLQGKEYQETETSPTFPQLQKEWLYSFLETARVDEVEAEVFWRDRLGSLLR